MEAPPQLLLCKSKNVYKLGQLFEYMYVNFFLGLMINML